MKTIEERKNKCAYNLRVIGHDEERVVKEAYARGAIEQQRIDIEHHAKLFIEFLVINLGIQRDAANQMILQLKNAMGYEDY